MPCGAAASGRRSNFVLGREVGVDHRARRRGRRAPPSPAGDDRSAAPARCRRRARGPGSRAPSACATQPATARIMRPPAAALACFSTAQPAELGEHLLGRAVADMAGVEDHHVGAVRRRGSAHSRAGASTSAIRALSYTFIWQPQVMTCRRLGAARGMSAVMPRDRVPLISSQAPLVRTGKARGKEREEWSGGSGWSSAHGRGGL